MSITEEDPPVLNPEEVTGETREGGGNTGDISTGREDADISLADGQVLREIAEKRKERVKRPDMKEVIQEEVGYLTKAMEGMERDTAVKGMAEHLANEMQINYTQNAEIEGLLKEHEELTNERNRLEVSVEDLKDTKNKLLKLNKFRASHERTTAVASRIRIERAVGER